MVAEKRSIHTCNTHTWLHATGKVTSTLSKVGRQQEPKSCLLSKSHRLLSGHGAAAATNVSEYKQKQKFTPRLSLQDISKLPKDNFEYDYVIDADNILNGIVVFSLEFNIGNTFFQ
jgi:hypothetical protein